MFWVFLKEGKRNIYVNISLSNLYMDIVFETESNSNCSDEIFNNK